MGSRWPYFDGDDAAPPAPRCEVRWLDPQQVLAEDFYHEADATRRLFLNGLVDEPGGSYPTWRRELRHDDEWDRGGCHG